MKEKLKVKVTLFVLYFAIENKKYTEKEIVRVSLLLITLFSMLKTQSP